jgi:tyrosyl-tRNA synthetase
MKSNNEKNRKRGLSMTVTEQIMSNFSRTTEQIFSLKEFEEMLNNGRRLRIKYGVDVTAPYLHIGHAVNLWMMRKLQDFGHKVVFLIGDATTQIGDPTGKNKTRPMVSPDDIERNTAQFIEQVKMILRFDDPKVLEIRRNSEWFNSMPMPEFLRLMSMVTHSRLISRDMFQKRIAGGSDIYMHELVYPILQGYDSVMLDSDLTIVGSDQLFNEMMGRFFQERFGQRQQVIITTKVTPGIDGVAKQSKSLDNYIGLGHSPRDKFGRIMKLPDALIQNYFEVYTEVPESELKEVADMVKSDPLEAKKRLAMEIVRRYHGDKAAKEEREWFDHTFSRRQVPADVPEFTPKGMNIQVLEVLRQFFGDKKNSSEIHRLIRQGAVTLNG